MKSITVKDVVVIDTKMTVVFKKRKIAEGCVDAFLINSQNVEVFLFFANVDSPWARDIQYKYNIDFNNLF